MPHASGIHYELLGPDDGEILILSPGLGGSAGYWEPNLAALAEHYRILLYDHRGTGRSDRDLPETTSIEAMAQDVLALMDRLRVPSAHFVGHALGGMIGAALALAHPDRVDRLVIVNGWAHIDPHTSRCFDIRLTLLKRAGPIHFLRAQPLFLYPADWISRHFDELDREASAQLGSFQGLATLEKRIMALRSFDGRGRLAGLKDKARVLVAEDDMLVPSSAGLVLARELGGAWTETMPSGGHACNVTDPALFNHLIFEFLRS